MDSDTLTFVEKYLKSTYPGIQIKTLVDSAGSKPGDNVAGVLKAVKVIADIDGEERKFDLVCKNSSTIPAAVEFLEAVGAFRREALMYSKILPWLNQFQIDYGVRNPTRIRVPKYYYSCIDEEGQLDRILLEDMRESGFTMMTDKYNGLNFNEVMLALPEIAKLHALSYAVKVITGKPMNEEYSCLNFPMVSYFLEQSRNYFRETVKFMEEIGETDIANSMKKYFGREMDIVRRTSYSSSQTDPLTVLCHFDFWLNNVLFKYESPRKPTDICVIDFQLSSTANIMKDIMYFLFVSTSTENRKLHLKTWLKCYYDTFCSVVNQFKDLKLPEKFEFSDFEELFRSHLPFAMIESCFALSFQQSDPSDLEKAMMILQPPDDPDHGTPHAKILLRSGNVKNKLLPIFKEMVEYGVL